MSYLQSIEELADQQQRDKAELEHLREENQMLRKEFNEGEDAVLELMDENRELVAEVRRLRLELAEMSDLCEHLRDKLEGKAK